MISLGGDHSISLPILRALAAQRPVGMVHIDAHTDMCDEEFGSRFTHGTPFRRAVEEGLLDAKRTVQIGIRGTADSEEGWTFSLESGMRVIFIEEFTKLGELKDRSDRWAQVERERAQGSWSRAVVTFEGEVETINKEIADLNLKVPSPRFQRAKVDAAGEIQRVTGRLG